MVVTVDFVLQPTRYSGYNKVPPVLHSKGRRFSSVCPHALPIFPFKTYSTHPRLLLKRTRRKEVWFSLAGLVSPRLEDFPHPPSTTNTRYHFFPPVMMLNNPTETSPWWRCCARFKEHAVQSPLSGTRCAAVLAIGVPIRAAPYG